MMAKLLRKGKVFCAEAIYRLLPRGLVYRIIERPRKHWLFIIGCNNSGTTLLKTLLEDHPGIVGIEGEGQYRTNALVTDRDLGLNRLFSERLDVFRDIEGKVDPMKVKYDWLVSLLKRRKKQHKYILEKTTVNAVRIPWLLKNFPDAKFVAIFREPYAVVEGMKRKENIPITRGANHWRITNEFILNDFKGFDRVYYIQYEDLTNDPDLVLTELCEFLEIQPLKPVRNKEMNVLGRKSIIQNQNPESLKRLLSEELLTIRRLTSSVVQEIEKRVAKPQN